MAPTLTNISLSLSLSSSSSPSPSYQPPLKRVRTDLYPSASLSTLPVFASLPPHQSVPATPASQLAYMQALSLQQEYSKSFLANGQAHLERTLFELNNHLACDAAWETPPAQPFFASKCSAESPPNQILRNSSADQFSQSMQTENPQRISAVKLKSANLEPRITDRGKSTVFGHDGSLKSLQTVQSEPTDAIRRCLGSPPLWHVCATCQHRSESLQEHVAHQLLSHHHTFGEQKHSEGVMRRPLSQQNLQTCQSLPENFQVSVSGRCSGLRQAGKRSDLGNCLAAMSVNSAAKAGSIYSMSAVNSESDSGSFSSHVWRQSHADTAEESDCVLPSGKLPISPPSSCHAVLSPSSPCSPLSPVGFRAATWQHLIGRSGSGLVEGYGRMEAMAEREREREAQRGPFMSASSLCLLDFQRSLDNMYRERAAKTTAAQAYAMSASGYATSTMMSGATVRESPSSEAVWAAVEMLRKDKRAVGNEVEFRVSEQTKDMTPGQVKILNGDGKMSEAKGGDRESGREPNLELTLSLCMAEHRN